MRMFPTTLEITKRRGGGGGGEGGMEYLWERDYKQVNESHGWYAILSSNPSFKLFELALRFSKFHFARGINERRRKKEEKKPVPI